MTKQYPHGDPGSISMLTYCAKLSSYTSNEISVQKESKIRPPLWLHLQDEILKNLITLL